MSSIASGWSLSIGLGRLSHSDAASVSVKGAIAIGGAGTAAEIEAFLIPTDGACDAGGVLAIELAGVLDHIATIETLDLADVPPTSHVVIVENALRPDLPEPCLPRERALESAPRVIDDGFAVPSPQA